MFENFSVGVYAARMLLIKEIKEKFLPLSHSCMKFILYVNVCVCEHDVYLKYYFVNCFNENLKQFPLLRSAPFIPDIVECERVLPFTLNTFPKWFTFLFQF